MSTNDSNNVLIGNRLREERERLCLSQALFSGKIGISRMSQVNYESGKRSPDAAYLLAAFENGVDVGYVVTGKRTKTPDFYRMATLFVLQTIEKRTGFSYDVLGFVIEAISDLAFSEWLKDRVELQSMPDVKWDMTQWIDLTLLKQLAAALFENDRLLRDIFGAVNFAVGEYGPYILSPEKRLATILMLFKAFRVADEVDSDMVNETIKLAAG